jgi:hypothetical protein
MEGSAVDCVAYLARHEPGVHVPSPAYLATMIEGAQENGLPEVYVNALRLITTL